MTTPIVDLTPVPLDIRLYRGDDSTVKLTIKDQAQQPVSLLVRVEPITLRLAVMEYLAQTAARQVPLEPMATLPHLLPTEALLAVLAAAELPAATPLVLVGLVATTKFSPTLR